MPRSGGPAVARVLEQVTKSARQHEMFSPGALVLVSVSGGPDSTCLLHALHRLSGLFRIELEVFHFDHGLRPDSASDAKYVAAQAKRVGSPLHVRTTDARLARGESVEMWARQARRDAQLEVAAEVGADRIATAHTMDDQAESVLMGVVTGSGLQGAAGIPIVNGPFVRPLVATSRAEVEAFCRALRLRPREDPMNADTRLLRGAVRHRAIPAIERALGREVRAPLARTADLLRADAHELNRQAAAAFGDVVEDVPGGVDLSVRALGELPKPIAGRIVEQALFRLGIPAERDHVDAILDLAAGRRGRRRDLPLAHVAVREHDVVRVTSGVH